MNGSVRDAHDTAAGVFVDEQHSADEPDSPEPWVEEETREFPTVPAPEPRPVFTPPGWDVATQAWSMAEPPRQSPAGKRPGVVPR